MLGINAKLKDDRRADLKTRDVREAQLLVWVTSMPACADINNALQSLTDTNFKTSEQHTSTSGQHKDATKAIKERDHSDTTKIVDCLSQRRPFGTDPSLRKIATGVVTKEVVNCDKAKEARDKIVSSMVGKYVHGH